jgi:hypothetical protein
MMMQDIPDPHALALAAATCTASPVSMATPVSPLASPASLQVF